MKSEMKKGFLKSILAVFIFFLSVFLLVGCNFISQTFHITFQYEDGVILEEKDVAKDAMITYTGTTPTKSATDKYTYVFIGWDHELGKATKDDTFIAQFEQKAIVYTITFKNYDGTVLETATVEAGTVPTYDGQIPQKPSDESKNYTFAGWDKELVAATADATYTATYSEEVLKYEIIFKNYDGTVLETVYVDAGIVPAYTQSTPTKSSTEMYDYTFANWDKEVVAATSDATYTAVYNETLKKYNVVFKDFDGTTLYSYTADAGTLATFTGETPSKSATPYLTFEFTGWDNELSTVLSDLVYTATYSETKILTYVDVNIDIYPFIRWANDGANFAAVVTYVDNTTEEIKLTYKEWTIYTLNMPKEAISIQLLRYSNDNTTVWESGVVSSFDIQKVDYQLNADGTITELVEREYLYFDFNEIIVGGDRFGIYFSDSTEENEGLWVTANINADGQVVVAKPENMDTFQVLRTSLTDYELSFDTAVNPDQWGKSIAYEIPVDKNLFVFTDFNSYNFKGQWAEINGVYSAALEYNAEHGSIISNAKDLTNISVGSKVAFIVSANEGYVIKEFKVNERVVKLPEDGLYTVVVTEDLVISVEYIHESELVPLPTITIDFNGLDPMVKVGNEAYCVYLYSKTTGANSWVKAELIDGIATIEIPEGTEYLQIIRIDKNLSNGELSWDLYQGWGQLSETALSTESTELVLTGIFQGSWKGETPVEPENTIDITIDFRGLDASVFTGGEFFALYAYSKTTGANTWIKLNVVDGIAAASLPEGTEYVQMIRLGLHLYDTPLSWDIYEGWGQLYETALSAESTELVLTGIFQGSWKVEAPEHTHNYVQKSDTTHHWTECECSDATEKEAHTGGEATETELAVCSVCGTSYGELKPHEHKYSEELTSDTEGHWYPSICGHDVKKDYAAHTGGEATTTTQAQCEVCGAFYGALKEPENTIDITIDFRGLDASVFTGGEFFALYAYSKTTGANTWIKLNVVDGIAAASLPEGTEYVQMIRLGLHLYDTPLSWDIYEGWGQLYETALSAESTELVLTGIFQGSWKEQPKPVDITIDFTGLDASVFTGGEFFALYAYSKTTGANTWIKLNVVDGIAAASLPEGTEYVQMIRLGLHLYDTPLSWDIYEGWGQLYETALSAESTELVLTGIFEASWK